MCIKRILKLDLANIKDCELVNVNKYQVFVDVAEDWDQQIDVIDFIVEADNAEEAYEKLSKDLFDGKHNDALSGREYYIWEVTEDDKIK